VVNALIEKLKTGSIKSVVLFGDQTTSLKTPYVVVKPESGAGDGQRQWRIIVHEKVGMYDSLSKYLFQELDELLVNKNGAKVFITDEAGMYRLYASGYTDIQTDTSDSTIFMERLFIQPFRNGGSI